MSFFSNPQPDSQVLPLIKTQEQQIKSTIPSVLSEVTPKDSPSKLFEDYLTTGEQGLKTAASQALNKLSLFATNAQQAATKLYDNSALSKLHSPSQIATQVEPLVAGFANPELEAGNFSNYLKDIPDSIKSILGPDTLSNLPNVQESILNLRNVIDNSVGQDKEKAISDMNSAVKLRNSLLNELSVLKNRLEVQGNLYTSNSQRTSESFLNSSGQKQVENTPYQLGDYGNSSFNRKADFKDDRFPLSQLKDTLDNTVTLRRASDDPTNHRFDNIAHIAVMPDGDIRAVYTRLNADNKEEIVNWHSISNPDYLKNLSSFSIPERARTSNLSVRTGLLNPLSYEDISSISQKNKEINSGVNNSIFQKVLGEGLEPTTSRVSSERSTTELPEQDTNNITQQSPKINEGKVAPQTLLAAASVFGAPVAALGAQAMLSKPTVYTRQIPQAPSTIPDNLKQPFLSGTSSTVPASILQKVLHVENRAFDTHAVRTNSDGSKDYGLFQINSSNLPFIQKSFKAQGRIFDPFDPSDSAQAANMILTDNYKKFSENMGRAPTENELIGSYNLGLSETIKAAKGNVVDQKKEIGYDAKAND